MDLHKLSIYDGTGIRGAAGRDIHFDRLGDRRVPACNEHIPRTAAPIMYKLMRTLVEVDFRGNPIADHVPEMAGGRRPGWSCRMGHIRALYQAARAELKRG